MGWWSQVWWSQNICDTYIQLYTYVHIYIVMCIYMFIAKINICMHACMHACMHTYIHTYIYIYIYIYIYTQNIYYIFYTYINLHVSMNSRASAPGDELRPFLMLWSAATCLATAAWVATPPGFHRKNVAKQWFIYVYICNEWWFIICIIPSSQY